MISFSEVWDALHPSCLDQKPIEQASLSGTDLRAHLSGRICVGSVAGAVPLCTELDPGWN